MTGRLFPSFGVGHERQAKRGLGDIQTETPVVILGQSFTYTEIAAVVGLGIAALYILDVGKSASRRVTSWSRKRTARQKRIRLAEEELARAKGE
jgi:alkylated DNA nucleotide flippase Atl1